MVLIQIMKKLIFPNTGKFICRNVGLGVGCIKLNVRMTQRFGVVVFHRSMVNWRGVKLNVRMTQRFGVVMFHRSMVDWRRG